MFSLKGFWPSSSHNRERGLLCHRPWRGGNLTILRGRKLQRECTCNYGPEPQCLCKGDPRGVKGEILNFVTESTRTTLRWIAFAYELLVVVL
jgi:hypothetical protein